MASESLYHAAATNRLMLRVAPRTSISRSAYFQAICVALDNTLTLPLFFPLGRNCVSVFGQTLRSCFPGLYIACLPWAIRYQPPGNRGFKPNEVTDFFIRMAEIISFLLVTFERISGDAEGVDRLDAAARLPFPFADQAAKRLFQQVRRLFGSSAYSMPLDKSARCITYSR